MSRPPKTLIITFRKGKIVGVQLTESLTPQELMRAAALLAQRAVS